MRVLFSIIPGHGHLFPNLPLANALKSVGHDVTFATSKSFGPTVGDYGFGAIPVGIDYTQGSVDWEDSNTDPVEQIMFVDSPPVVLEDLGQYLDENDVDVILVDPTETGSMIAAEASGIPWGAVVPGKRNGFMPAFVPHDPERRDSSFVIGIRSGIARMREAVGLPPEELLLGEAPYDRRFSFCMAPESFNGWRLQQQHHTSHPLRPEIHASDSEDDWLDELPSDHPVVSVSFGTLFGSVELYTTAVEAALGTGAFVVVSTSYELPVEGERLKHVKWVSMDRLMDRTDVLVHHAGWGSTVAALASGTPSVIVPIGADQFTNAQAFRNTGAGIPVDVGAVESALEGAVSEVLKDDLYLRNAKRLQREIDAMPSAIECVPLVEELAEKGVVFNKPME